MVRLALPLAADPVAVPLRSAFLPVKVAALLPVICASGAQLSKGRILSARDWTTPVPAFESHERSSDLIGVAEPGSAVGLPASLRHRQAAAPGPARADVRAKSTAGQETRTHDRGNGRGGGVAAARRS